MGEGRARLATEADDGSLAGLHREVFPDYSSSALGARFCTALLRAYRLRPDAFVLVVDGRSEPRGYLVGATPEAQRAINGDLRVRAVGAMLVRAWRPRSWARLTSPAVRARIRRAIGRRPSPASPPPGASAGAAEPPVPAADVRVVLVGVTRSARGQGVADLLLAAFAAEAWARGHLEADLVVAPDNEAATRCYERNGWRGGPGPDAPSARYRLDLTSPPASPRHGPSTSEGTPRAAGGLSPEPPP